MHKLITTMVKRKAIRTSVEVTQGASPAHSFVEKETLELRGCLLDWYTRSKRTLPWRTIAEKESDVNKRIYSVWVSEIMLQQTQVATVIDYYNKWIERWPTVQDLAKATLEEVNEMWSGLGYYSRGSRLHEGALKVVSELRGEMPQTAEGLQRELPGVGRYTAGAIASIALSQATGIVDGNVSRVFSRMRLIGADITGQQASEAIWSLANRTVDPERPGDYNQALMELGATVCTPKAPQCASCPVQQLCNASALLEQEKQKSAGVLLQSKPENGSRDIVDIECAQEGCILCLPSDAPWDSSKGVMNYPRKGKKKAPRVERTGVCVLSRSGPQTEYLIVQRPETGLLANLWEFPSVLVDSDSSTKQVQTDLELFIKNNFAIKANGLKDMKFVEEVVHIFSHIHQTYVVVSGCVGEAVGQEAAPCTQPVRWVSREEMAAAALSTAMRKVFKACENRNKVQSQNKQSSKSCDGKKQLGIGAFFKKKS